MNKEYILSKIQECYKEEIEQFLDECNKFTNEDKNYILDKTMDCYKKELKSYFINMK